MTLTVPPGPKNLLPILDAAGVYLDSDGSRWIRTDDVWRRVDPRPRPTSCVPSEDDPLVFRRWPDVLAGRLLDAGFDVERACTIAESQLQRLRRGDHPRDVLGGWLFSAGVHIPDALAKTLDRMFLETNFVNPDDEWVWKHLFEAGVDGLPDVDVDYLK